MRVAILGFGLIGGSIAQALAVAPDRAAWTVAAWSPSGDGPRRAAADGTIARAAPDVATAIEGAHLIVLAAPPQATLDLLDLLAESLQPALPEGAAITDVASTKGQIVARARQHGLQFVGGHPMAGRETSGYDAATADLFAGHPWVVVPSERPGSAAPADPAATIAVETLAAACGARPIRLTAEAHDRAVSAISHLPLVVAAALVETVAGAATDPGRADEWPLARSLAAGGWRDMTRLARGDVEMGTGIAATNAGELASRIRALRAVLDGWLADLERPGGPDEARLADRLRAARTTLEAGDQA